MRLRSKQAGLGLLALGKCPQPGSGIQTKLLSQLLRISCIPSRIKGLGVAYQFLYAHPSRQVGLFGKVSNTSEHRNRFSYWIPPENPHRSAFRPEQAENMFDQSGFTRSIL